MMLLATAALALAAPDPALAQPSSPIPASTGLPSSAPASGGAQRKTEPTQRSMSVPDTGAAGGRIKRIAGGSLTRNQVVYGLTHQVQEAKQLSKLKTADFDNLRIYKLPSSMQRAMKVSDGDGKAVTIAMLGNGAQEAHPTAASSPSANDRVSPIQYLRDTLAGFNVSNALDNPGTLDASNANVNVANVPFSNVLNSNNVSIGHVIGLYIGGGGIITTITK
ncbi:MAG: hypothetical protein NVS3B7_04860 [Candidatus Elarobacter sp.]